MKTRHYKAAAVWMVMFYLTGCAGLSPRPASLYERLGEKSAIDAVVNDFVNTVGADTRITNEAVKAKLGSIDIATLKSHVSNLVCNATGGPCEYKGRDMKTTHRGLGITTAEWGFVVDDLVATLEKYAVPEREKNELLGLLAPMKDDIVEVRR